MREKLKITLFIAAVFTSALLFWTAAVSTHTPPVSDVKVVLGEQFEFNAKLQTDADALLSLFDNMPPVSVRLKDEPIIKSGTNVERGVAYTVCEGKKFPVIYVKKAFYQNANYKQRVNILKHELTHAWFCRQGVSSNHDGAFHQKFEAVGGFGN